MSSVKHFFAVFHTFYKERESDVALAFDCLQQLRDPNDKRKYFQKLCC
jgi:hypothetical protein